jgi:transposase
MGHWEVTTLIGALGLDGVRASFAVESATDTDVFRLFLTEVLVPALRPGDVVIWDNLSAHKNAQCAALVEQAGAHVLRLPPYSPDFNPIESCWSKIKERLRSEAARTKGSAPSSHRVRCHHLARCERLVPTLRLPIQFVTKSR